MQLTPSVPNCKYYLLTKPKSRLNYGAFDPSTGRLESAHGDEGSRDRPVRRAVALLNSFDFSCGDSVTRDGG